MVLFLILRKTGGKRGHKLFGVVDGLWLTTDEEGKREIRPDTESHLPSAVQEGSALLALNLPVHKCFSCMFLAAREAYEGVKTQAKNPHISKRLIAKLFHGVCSMEHFILSHSSQEAQRALGSWVPLLRTQLPSGPAGCLPRANWFRVC